jgi:hypothetical protein
MGDVNVNVPSIRRQGLVPGLVPLGDSITKFVVTIGEGADMSGTKAATEEAASGPPVLIAGSLAGNEPALPSALKPRVSVPNIMTWTAFICYLHIGH